MRTDRLGHIGVQRRDTRVTRDTRDTSTGRTGGADWKRKSAQISTLFQVVIGAISLVGFSEPFTEKNRTLIILLILDTVVQFIELGFYILFICWKQLSVKYRYIDWFITTPTMLFTLVTFNEYVGSPDMVLEDFVSTHLTELILLLYANGTMLTFGLLKELKYLKTKIAISLGFVPFTILFLLVFIAFTPAHPTTIALSALTSIVWSGYGIASLFDETTMTISFNILDVLSKNAFGLFIGIYLILQEK